MEATRVTRATYKGGPSRYEYKVVSLGIEPLGSIHTQSVESATEYEAGCSSCGEECYGHMCTTPSGVMLVPQSLASKRGETVNEYLDAAKMAFSGYTEEYIAKLISMNKTKLGHMRRDILGSTIIGSMRLIIAPLTNSPKNHIYIPRTVAESLRTPYEQTDPETGMSLGTVGEREARDGDWCIIWRPPTLSPFSLGAFVVHIHDSPVFKIPIQSVGTFHGDFDGDEMQLCMIYSDGAVKECEGWVQDPNPKFDAATEAVSTNFSMLEGSDLPHSFISYTAMTMREIMDGDDLPMFADAARVKLANTIETGHRFRHPEEVAATFVRESIRGCSDVTRQQLFQGPIGYKSRTAKDAAMCFARKGNGLYVSTSSGPRLVSYRETQSYGCPALRGVSFICAAMQQAALDTHRAQTSDMPSLDMIQGMIAGGSTTVVAISGSESSRPLSQWASWDDGSWFCIITKDQYEEAGFLEVTAAYAPWVLRHQQNPRVCAIGGLAIVCNYFDIALSSDEAEDVCDMLCYQCDKSDLPVTTENGMRARDIGWADRWMATSYKEIDDIWRDATAPQQMMTSTLSSMIGNFEGW